MSNTKRITHRENLMSRFVVVTTDINRRGVFAGFLESQEDDRVVLAEARNCIYWSAETKGVLGLAAHGPQAGSRIGPAAPRLELNGVTAIVDVTEEAQKRWELEPWE